MMGTFACPHCGQDTPHHHSAEYLRVSSLTFALERLERIQERLERGLGFYSSAAIEYGKPGNHSAELDRLFARDLRHIYCEIGWRRQEELAGIETGTAETGTGSVPKG